MIHPARVPYSIRLLLTNRCNLNCTLCLRDASDTSSNEELSTEEWLDFFMRLKALRVFDISLSGGEIFLRDDLFILLRKLRENRMHRISLLTNATMISSQNAERLRDLKINLITVSVDGLEESHDAIRGDGSFQRTIHGIHALLEKGIKPAVSFTPTCDNYKDLGPLLDFMVSLGITSLQVNTLSPEGRCINIYKNIALKFPGQIEETLAVIAEKQKEFPQMKINCQFGFYYYLPQLYKDFQKNPGKHQIQHLKSGCGAASTSCVITPTGDAVPCEGFSDFKGGNIREKDLLEIWNESENFQAIRDLSKIAMDHVPHCKECKYIYLCDGGCRANAYLLYNDLLAPGGLCPVNKNPLLTPIRANYSTPQCDSIPSVDLRMRRNTMANSAKKRKKA